MRVVIAADRTFASRERSMLSRLQVGLADEGVRVVQALPQGVEIEQSSVLLDSVHYEQVGLPLSRRWRATRAARVITAVDPVAPPEIVHVFGGSIWPFGAALARELGAALVLEAWRARLLPQVQHVREGSDAAVPTFVVAPDARLAEYLRREAPSAVIREARWGVHAPPEPRRVLEPGAAWSLMVAGAGLDRRAYVAAFEAIADIVRGRPDVLVFADAVAARRAELWLLAAKLGIRERLSLVDEMDANRELVLRGDVLILPEARGEQRTLVLEAMGGGMPVVAAADPLNGTLIDRRSALLVPAGDRSAWTSALARVLDDAAAVGAMVASAHAYVRDEHRPSVQVRGVLQAYEAAVGRSPIPFPS
ncbi:MAG TPA: glycosyltransferase [Phycisphaerales bacterium]|nr:glycosyltransferase [Phycisphaerales bacterium]